ncbi:hypothetical protein [Xanthobacter flavus]|uniref:hypothetical protein n=1 Tax=Xanthobacter flavus TaxID=281 RepID=UPI001AEB2656|nr:hypothetical protein [Xanthobacter flavus]MBP2147904.1 hypothetical protein [Xanthobacter flavus]
MGGKVEGGFNVEEWDDAGMRVVDVVASCGNVVVALAAFDAALTQRQVRYLLLRHGTRVLRRSPFADKVDAEERARNLIR